LSLGTGSIEFEDDSNATSAASWNALEWLLPAIVFLDRATISMTEYYHGSVFGGFQPSIRYLRIEV